MTAGLYYPLATAMAALATAQLVRRYTRGESWHELGWLGDLRSARLARMLSYQTCILSVLAVLFTKGALEPKTVLTLILAAVSLGLTAVECGWSLAGVAGGLSWAAAWGVGAMVVADEIGLHGGRAADDLRRDRRASGGVLALGAGRTMASRRVERQGSIGRGFWTGRDPLVWGSPGPLERVALACSLFSATVVLMAATSPGALGGFWTLGGVGVLLGSALLQILLVPRWQAEWLVYLAQAVMVGAYIDFRMAYPAAAHDRRDHPDSSRLSRPGHRRSPGAATKQDLCPSCAVFLTDSAGPSAPSALLERRTR